MAQNNQSTCANHRQGMRRPAAHANRYAASLRRKENMNRQVPINIKVKFAGEIFYLENHQSRPKSEKSGVMIWLKMRPANEVQPMAEIPDGTLDKYKHCRPQIVSCDWVAA